MIVSYGKWDQATLRPVLHRTLWSLQSAFEGRRPSRGPGMSRASIPQRHRKFPRKLVRSFAVVEYKGEWEWHSFVWELSSAWNRQFICHMCRATRKEVHGTSFINFGVQFERRSAVDCVLNCMPASPSPLVLVPGWSPMCMRYCSMHVLNLGIYQTLVGEGILWIAEHGGFHAGSLDERLRTAFTSFKKWMSATGVYCSGP